MSASDLSTSRGYGPSVRNRLHFDGDERNFELWYVKFMGYMTLRGLRDIIEPPPPSSTTTTSTSSTTPAAEGGGTDNTATTTGTGTTTTDPDPVKNAEAYSELILYIDNRSLSLVMRDANNDGRKAMKILKEHYMGKGKPRILTLWCELTSLTKGKEESLTDYIIGAENAASALRTAGEVVSDALLIAMVLKGLPSHYKPFEVVITQNTKDVTFAEFKVALRNYEDTEKARGSRDKKNEDSVKHFHPPRNVGNEKPIICHHCGTPGHKSPQCPSKQQNRNKNKNKKQFCNFCQMNNHSDKTCRKQKGSNSSGADQNAAAKATESKHHEHSFVFAIRDAEKVDDNAVVQEKVDDNVVVQEKVEDKVVVEENVDDKLLVEEIVEVKVEETVEASQPVKDVVCASSSASSGDDVSLVDSGATSHITNDDSLFISTDDSFQPQKHSITLADGTETTGMALKRGTIKFSLKNSDGKIVNGILENVLYIPTYPQNIFSVKAAIRKGSSVHFNSDQPSCLVTPSGMMFPTEELDFGLDYLRNYARPSSDNKSQDFVCGVRSVETWHRVLGHCNRGDLLKSQHVVEGMKISGTGEFECETCPLGKLTQNISRIPDKRASHPMEFVHTDLSGAVDPVSIEGHKYVISFTDDFSGYVFTYFLKRKSDATKALEKFLADSAPCGNVKRMRLDNGGEFVGQEYKNVLIKNKIKQEPSCPDSPHQNGTAERWWRTCFGASRCMLLESGLPKNMWPYAVMYTTHVRNRVFQQRTKQTPYYLLTNKVPNVSKLAIFGSVCFAYDHEYKKKLDARSRKGIFVGMDKESPAYLVYFPDDQKVRKYRTVKCTDKMYENRNVVGSHDSDEDSDDEIVFPGKASSVDTPAAQPDVPSASDVPPTPAQIAEPVVAVDNPLQDFPNDAQLMGEPVIDVDMLVDPGHLHTVEQPEGRYPSRERRPPPHLNDYDTSTSEDVVSHIRTQVHTNIDYCFSASSMQIPKTYKQAMSGPQAEKWKAAMDSEVNSLKSNKTYSLVPPPKDKKVIGGRWVYSIKQNPDGTDLFKARYVAQGFNQVYGSDYFETYSPTAKMTSVRMLVQYAVQHDLVIHQLDVRTAYLNAPVDCEIFMRQVEGYVDVDKQNHVCFLHKSLYGLKQSGRNWNILLTEFLKNNSYVASTADPCLYISKSKTDLILYWVDDIISACKTMKKMNSIKNILKGKFKMKDLGPLKHFLGMNFEQVNSTVTIDQTLYLESILQKYKMADCKPRATPCELQSSHPSSPPSHQCHDSKQFREIVGSLIYATTCTRPDLSWVVSRLSQNLANPRESDWVMLKHVLRYVKGTSKYKLCYTKSEGDLELIGYSDSDWASNNDDRRSTSGYCFYVNTKCSPISWKPKKQQTVALSSCEAEYMALGLSTQEALYLQRFSTDLDVLSKPLVIYSDSQSAIDLVKNPVNHNRSKHIDIRHHFIRENMVNGIVDYRHVPTDINVADCFTKALAKPKLQSFLPKLLVAS